MTGLPGYLRGIGRVVADQTVVSSPLALRVRERLPHLSWEILPEGRSLASGLERGDILYLKHYKGRFLRFCPGTSHYRCCGYQIIHIGENCPLRCSYCILQAYFQDRVLKVWANQDDLWTELDRAFTSEPGRRYRVGTGEFTDSLVLESLTGYSRDLAGFLSAYPQVCLELKSKVADLSWMDAVPDPSRVLPAWSMNAPEIVEREEQGACASLEERLAAARTCAGTAVRAAARAAAGQDSARVQPQPEGLVDRLGQDRAVPAVLEGTHEPGRGEDDLEDAVGDAARLRVRAHERPGRPARALGGLQDLLPARADHLGVGRRTGGGRAGP